MSIQKKHLRNWLDNTVQQLLVKQSPDGAFRFCFEGNLLTECGTIFLLRALAIENKAWMKQMTENIVSKQQSNGSWRCYPDEIEGNYSETMFCFCALLLSGQYTEQSAVIQKSKKWLLTQRQTKLHFIVQFFLMAIGALSYPTLPFPLVWATLPENHSLSMYNVSNYARIHSLPMLICWNKKFKTTFPVPKAITEVLATYRVEDDDWFQTFVSDASNEEHSLMDNLSRESFSTVDTIMKKLRERREGNGLLYGYVSCSLMYAFAELAVGTPRSSAIFKKLLKGIKQYTWHFDHSKSCIQNSPSEIWDTALITEALATYNREKFRKEIQNARYYLVQHQHVRMGDWHVHAPDALPGGFGFSEANTFVPDVDDTSAVLRALGKDAALTEPEVFHKAKAWLLHMQNSDGGFGAFEKDANKKIFQWLPLQNAKDALLDESTADLTGRTLYTLRKYCNMSPQHNQIKQCVRWLLNNQNNDGAWYGKWGVYYIYGTWAACSGLGSITDNQKVNVALEHAQKWLLSIQHDDGGWGESGRSAVMKRYEALPYSTVVQTAWAMDALLHTGLSVQSDAIQRGLQFLLHANNWSGKSVSYPTGLGLPGAFYIRYYSYPYLFPLSTIARVHSLMTE